MKEVFANLRKSELFRILMAGVLMYVSMNATIMLIIHIPPEVILDSGLDQILMVFED